MKRGLISLSIFLFFFALFILPSPHAKGLLMTLQEIEQEVDYLTTIIKECERDYVEYEKEISDIEDDYLKDVSAEPTVDEMEILDRKAPHDVLIIDLTDRFDFLDDPDDCNYDGDLNNLKKELDQQANPGPDVVIPEEKKKKIEQIKTKLDGLQERNENLKTLKEELKERVGKLKEAVGKAPVSELASQINELLKKELEKEFGPLTDQNLSDETHIYGRVIAIDYVLPAGKHPDDSWGQKAVAALARLGIKAWYEPNEVRADGQIIAGKKASHMQVTTGTVDENTSVFGFTARFSESERQ